jgi:hypothetical protein
VAQTLTVEKRLMEMCQLASECAVVSNAEAVLRATGRLAVLNFMTTIASSPRKHGCLKCKNSS